MKGKLITYESSEEWRVNRAEFSHVLGELCDRRISVKV
jgi:hypothetical protein